MLLFLAALVVVICASPAPAPTVIFLHGRIVEEGGERPTSPEFGVYEYQAILGRLRAAGFTVLSERRPQGTDIDQYARHIVDQVNGLIAAGTPPASITVAGFSKGGGIAIVSSSLLGNPSVNFVFMAACGDWASDRPDFHVTGRMLSLYEASDDLGRSCAPLFSREGRGSVHDERELNLGLRHGTFFQPRPEWIDPLIDWIRSAATAHQ